MPRPQFAPIPFRPARVPVAVAAPAGLDWSGGALGVNAAAEFLAVSRSRLYELVREGKLGFIRQDGKRKFSRAMLVAYLESGEG